ncbi:hypothetical protein PGAG_00165 [Phaeocystis globosa virus 12T]|uniref:Uncharacterized protein n=1 Tax=Phaeocystis globosa virus PgV-16T TaxID=3071227 RepID=A0AC59EX34_9VIRU|nr:hypothetical protein PGCG_00206 [Phaeocystis globosa virus]AET73054.1 hypothetical protein PGAG_00165 [Phaeocystis globosa virus 12T]AET73877.1 hypothetical protein PGBG_00169 [Phaeocystis globosa virus 14T]AGM15517.1 hypothetical protein PGCG_00206 [Phaeocystis globosa virus PgV-16T]UYE94247.1 hypothetical protein PGV14T_00206 [Phaeocystis globosa virus]
MEITDFSYFKTDNKCHGPKDELNNESALNTFIGKNFDTHTFSIGKNSPSKSNVDECKKKALAGNKSLFLLGNASVDADTKSVKYDCLIPKVDKKYTNGNIANLLRPFNDLITDLFGSSSIFSNTETATAIEFDSTKQRTNINDIPNCFSIDQDNIKDTFSKSGKYVIYKTSLVSNSGVSDQLRGTKSLDYYTGDYNSIIQQTDGVLDVFKQMFKNAVCERSSVHMGKLDGSIIALQQHYQRYFSSLDLITTDLSNMSVLTEYDTLYLEKLQRDIDSKKKELKSLIGFDGANNGKLSDTEFMRNLKLSENILLFFVLIFVIYAYRRKLI